MMYSSASAFRLASTHGTAARAALCCQASSAGAARRGMLAAAYRALHVSPAPQYAESKGKKTTEKKPASPKGSPETSKKSAVKKADPEKQKLVSQLGKDKLPRKFSSPWMLFNYQHIQGIKSRVPAGEKMPDAPSMTKESSAAYKQLSESQLETLKREWEQKRDEYNQAFEKLVGSLSSEDIKKENAYRAQQRKTGKSNKKNLIDPTKPKAPKNGYMLYYLEQKANGTFSDQHVTNVTKLCAEKWHDMSEEEKQTYEKKAEQERQRYNREIEQWKSDNNLS